MIDRDKVSKGLKLCVTTLDFCNECPYDGEESCIENLHDDTLSLLKEHEAKILTVDEARNLIQGDDIWIEHIGDMVYAATVWNVNPALLMCRMNFTGNEVWDSYGVEWRVWTARPTEEQCEAVEWDD